MVRRGLALVFGGSDKGSMGVLADEVLDGDGEVIGVIPRPMVRNGWHHDNVTDLRIVESMHERKFVMYSLADAIVALPGGIGTLDEFIEMLAWMQLGIHEKPIGLLNVEGYFDPLLEMFSRAVEEGFLDGSFHESFVAAGSSGELLDGLESFRVPEKRYRWNVS